MPDRFEPAPQDLVVTILGAHLEPRESTTVRSAGLVALLGEFGFSEGASRVALTRLVRRDLLARVRDGRTVSYLLTPRALGVLAEGDRRIFELGRSRDGSRPQWTVLWHAIPDELRGERAALVRRLRFLGFGQVQDGTWLAAADRSAEVTALLDDLGVAEHAGMLLGAPVPGFAAFARRVWDLDALDERYRDFVRDFSRGGADGPAAAFHLRTRLVHTFRQFPVLDPELPADLLPPPEHRAAAVELFHTLYPALAAPARDYFDEVMSQC